MPSIFSSVQYISPFAPQPIAQNLAGVQASLDNTGVQPTYFAYAQLLANQTPIGYGTGGDASSVRVLNLVPLGLGPVYVLQVQFGAPGQKPADLDWSGTTIPVYSAPVVVQQLRITSLLVTGTDVTFSWTSPEGAPVSGAYLQLIDTTTNSITSDQYFGTAPSATFTATFKEHRNYQAIITAVQPIVGGTSTGTFAAPYSAGPPTVPQAIPTAAPTITSVTCDDGSLTAQWIADAPPSGTAPSYELLLLSGSKLLATVPGGPLGGQIIAGGLATIATPQLAGRTRYGAFVGPIGTAASIFPLVPTITSVAVTGSTTITAQLVSPGALPTGGSLVATLYTNGVAGPTQTLASAGGPVSWSGITVNTANVYAIDVALSVTAGSVTSRGPRSPQVIVPLAAPTNVSASYDGQTVVIDFSLLAGQAIDSYLITLTDNASGTKQISAGSGMPIAFPVDLDLSKTWSATVTPTSGIVQTLPAKSAVILPVIAAPSLTSVVYDGASLSLQWSAAKLPFITGYQVSVSGGPTVVTTANQTACTIPLTPALASGATVTVTGLSLLRNTPASVAVAVLSNTVEITSVTIVANVVAVWTVSGSPPALRAELMIGDTVQSVIPSATATGVTFAAPTPSSQPYRLRARAVSADGISLGPPADPVDLLLTPPVFKSGYLGNGQMTLRWDPVNRFGADGYLLTATPSSGTAVAFVVSGDSYDGFAPATFLTAGTLSIKPVSARCSGPNVSVPIHAPGSFTTGSYSDGTLSISVNLGVVGGTDTFWLDVLLDGVMVARNVLVQSTTNPLQSPFTVAVAIPEGANAMVRLADIGPGSLGAAVTAPIPSVRPMLIGAAYDGTKLHVAWEPTPGPGVNGYVVSVANASPTIPDTYVAGAASATTSIGANLTYPFATNLAVTVRAAFGSSGNTPYIQGPPSLPLPPALAGTAYSVAVGQAGNPPYVYWRGQYQALADVSGKAIVLYLPKPFTGVDNPTVPSTANPVFLLAPSPNGSQLPYQLTISAAAWTTLGADTVRTSLHDSFVQFLSDVEDKGVFPWAIPLIRQLIATAMPQTFEETLYYRYGLWRDKDMRVVDLTPGMRLQLSNALFQTVEGGASGKNGFIALGNELMDVVDAIPQGGAGTLPTGSGRSISVDAFLSLLYPGGGTPSAHPIAAGPIDFFNQQNRACFYRLFYPPTFPFSGSTGSTSLESNITLIGTTSWKTLATITQQYAQHALFPSGIDYFAAYFRGRPSITPLINVTVQSEPRWVALGTSARQVLAAQGLAPYYGGNGGDALSLRRGTANLFTYATANAGLSLDPVNLGSQDLGGLTPLYWPVDVPVVGGDQLGLRQL